MASAAVLPGAAAPGMLFVTTAAAYLRWPSTGSSQLQMPSSGKLGCCPARYGAGTPIDKGRITSCALQRDDVQATSSTAEEKVADILSYVDGARTGFEELVRYSAELEPTIQNVERESTGTDEGVIGDLNSLATKARAELRKASRKNERRVYLLAAMVSTGGFTSLSISACVYRFWVQMPENGALPYGEVCATFALAVGAAIGMEYWARWAHKALWHASLWHMHESHHQPRDGPFETNDVFAIINAVPAIGLLLYGFLNPGIGPALCYGTGLGITMFGIAYMFVHDGLVHRRFPVGPVAEVPYLQRVAAAHQLHHADLYEGVPYGLFLGPQELEEIGGAAELERCLARQQAKAAAGAPLEKDH